MRTMKISLLTAAITGLLAASSANAWTVANNQIDANTVPISTGVQISSRSFSDPAFGYQAWTHFGKWGVINAAKGQTVTITVDNPQYIGSVSGGTGAGIHPAVTVWKRPIGTEANPYVYYEGAKTGYQKDASGNVVKDASGNRIPNSVANRREVTNLAPASYTPDHNFFPLNDYIETGASQQHIQSSGGGGAPTPYGCTDSGSLTCAVVTRTLTDASGTSIPVTAKTTEFWKAAKRDLSGYATPGIAPVLADDGTTEIGFPRMLHVAAAYDADGATKLWNGLGASPRLKQVKDGTPGKVVVSFKANEDSQYQFYLGGMNPDPGSTGDQDKAKSKFTVDVAVNVQ